jgi:hypothetical protein
MQLPEKHQLNALRKREYEMVNQLSAFEGKSLEKIEAMIDREKPI